MTSTAFEPQQGHLEKDKCTLCQESSQPKFARYRLLGYAVLLGAIVGGSSIGVLANFVPVKSSFAKNAWRSGLNSVIFALPALVEYWYQRGKVDYSKLVTPGWYWQLLAMLSFQVVWTLGLIYASLNTI